MSFFRAGYNTSTADHNWWGGGSENMNFYTQIQHLRIEIGSGNEAATGILWGVAQQTSIRDVTVEAGPAAIAIDVSARVVTPRTSTRATRSVVAGQLRTL